MVVTVRHAFESEKSDGPDATEVRPSDWNADHIVEGLEDVPIPTPGTQQVVHVKDFGATGDGVTDDTVAIQTALTSLVWGQVLEFGDRSNNYRVTATITHDTGCHLRGDGARITCLEDGLDGIFDFTAMQSLSIRGLTFSMNFVGRSILTISNSADIFITDCEFNGYSSDFGIGSNDASISFEGSIQNAKVTGCTFVGGSGSEIGADHPRHISLNGPYVEFVLIADNIFRDFSQAIVSWGGQHITISNNLFINGSDNGIYILSQGVGTKGQTIVGNEFYNCEEGLVILGGTTEPSTTSDIMVVGNRFKNCTNKAIAMDGWLSFITISGNSFITEGAMGSHIGKRGDNDQRTFGLLIVGNNFHGEVDYAGIFLHTQYNFVFNSNAVHITPNGDDEFWMRIEGLQSINGVISGNIFSTDGSSADARIRFSNDPAGYVEFGNITDGGRFMLEVADGLSHALMQLNADGGPSTLTKRMVWSDGAPTEGTWTRGDIAFDLTPSAGSFAGWVCVVAGTPGTWKTFGAVSA